MLRRFASPPSAAAALTRNYEIGNNRVTIDELWKPVVGHENVYEVSDQGRVRSLARRVRLLTRTGEETSRSVALRILRPGRVSSGHVSVAIGKGNTRLVHQLVLEAFVGPCPEGCEVLHLNHSPDDNRLSNLKYGTRSENLRMDYAAGKRTVPAAFIGARWR